MEKRMPDMEPLEPSSWLLAIGRLLAQLDGPTPEVERLIRRAYHLLQLTPRPLRQILRTDCDEQAFEHLLEDGDLRAAALALVSPPLIHWLVEGDDGLFEAGVRLPGGATPATARSASPSAALVKAWAQCVAALGSTSPSG